MMEKEKTEQRNGGMKQMKSGILDGSIRNRAGSTEKQMEK
jgi:hypothetical protein